MECTPPRGQHACALHFPGSRSPTSTTRCRRADRAASVARAQRQPAAARAGPIASTTSRFADIERLIAPGEVLVFNDTRVIKARLFGRKPSGGKAELLVERILAPRRALALVRTSHSPKPGTVFEFGEPVAACATVCGRDDDFFALEFDADVLALLEAHGHVPLPPYIAHADAPEDSARYQTVYAREPGAVAAPTAGLHFSERAAAAAARGTACSSPT